jgi:serine/threonine protein kinase
VLTHPATRDPAFQAKFAAEMLTLRRLTHPNIARFLDSGLHAGLLYYASEYVEGRDLATLLALHEKTAEQPGLPWQTQVFSMAIQALRALKHGHHRSIFHRDLKPSNLMLGADGTLKVTDFGVAKIIAIPPLTLPSEAMGTVGYLAPEHFTGKPISRRSDLYSLGGVLYTLLTGRPPFQASTSAEFMHKHCYALPDRPINFVPKLPPDLDEFVCQMLAKDPSRRPRGAANLLDDLDQLRAKLERKGHVLTLPPAAIDPTGTHAPLSEAAIVPTRPDTTAHDRRDRFVRATILGSLFLLVVAGILYAFFRPGPDPQQLWDAAQPLLNSDSPEDWDRARDEYLDAITTWHPNWNPDGVRSAKQRAKDRKQLQDILSTSGKTKYSNEAERHYQRGLKLAQAGDAAGAKRLWAALVTATERTPATARWLDLADRGLKELTVVPVPARDLAAVETRIQAARELRIAGRTLEADAIVAALAELYRDEPTVLESLKR